MKKTNKRYIIWDLDGTLWTHKNHEVAIIADVLGIPFTEKFEKHFFGMIEKFNEFFADKLIVRDKVSILIEDTIPELFFYGITGEQFLNAWQNADTNLLNEQARFVLKKKQIKIGWSPLGKNKYQYNVVAIANDNFKSWHNTYLFCLKKNKPVILLDQSKKGAVVVVKTVKDTTLIKGFEKAYQK